MVSFPIIICFLNRKGGVGKTSSCHHLGGLYAKYGYKVLLVDLDPQASLTQGLLGGKAALSLPPEKTLAALFSDCGFPDPNDVIYPTRFDNLFLAASGAALNKYNLPDPQRYTDLQSALALLLAEVKPDYELILIDCPPNLNLCSWAALVAADFCIIPLQAEDYGSQGIVHVKQMIAQVRRTANPKLRLLGYLLTLYRKRLSLHRAYREQLEEEYGSDVFTTVVPDFTHYKEAITMNQPISAYKPKSEATRAAQAVADEILTRIAALDSRQMPLVSAVTAS